MANASIKSMMNTLSKILKGTDVVPGDYIRKINSNTITAKDLDGIIKGVKNSGLSVKKQNSIIAKLYKTVNKAVKVDTQNLRTAAKKGLTLEQQRSKQQYNLKKQKQAGIFSVMSQGIAEVGGLGAGGIAAAASANNQITGGGSNANFGRDETPEQGAPEDQTTGGGGKGTASKA